MNEFKRETLNILTAHLFNTVSHKDVLKFKIEGNKSTIFIGDRELTDKHKIALISEANKLKDSLFWETIVKTLKNQANLKLYNNSKSDDDLILGKGMLITIDLLEQTLYKLKQLK